VVRHVRGPFFLCVSSRSPQSPPLCYPPPLNSSFFSLTPSILACHPMPHPSLLTSVPCPPLPPTSHTLHFNPSHLTSLSSPHSTLVLFFLLPPLSSSPPPHLSPPPPFLPFLLSYFLHPFVTLLLLPSPFSFFPLDHLRLIIRFFFHSSRFFLSSPHCSSHRII